MMGLGFGHASIASNLPPLFSLIFQSLVLALFFNHITRVVSHPIPLEWTSLKLPISNLTLEQLSSDGRCTASPD